MLARKWRGHWMAIALAATACHRAVQNHDVTPAPPVANRAPQPPDSASVANESAPPVTARDRTVDHFFGVTVPDPYRWLEDGDAPAVKEWIGAENAHTGRVLATFPGRESIARRVQELSLTSTQRFDPVLAGGRLFFLEQTPPQAQPVLVATAFPDGAPKVLVDPNTSGGTAITCFFPSGKGTYVAYGTAEGGSEDTTLHVVRISDGKPSPDSLPRAGGGTTPQAVAWDEDEKGFVYARLPLAGSVPDTELEFNAALYHHVLGAPVESDTLVFGKGLSPVAEYSFATSGDGKRVAMLVHFGDGSPARVYLKRRGVFEPVLGPDAMVATSGSGSQNGGAASFLDDRLLVISNREAPRGKLLAIDSKGAATDLVGEQAWAMHAVYAIRGGFLLVMVNGTDLRVDRYDARGKLMRELALPDRDFNVRDVAASDGSTDALVALTGFRFAGRWVRFDAKRDRLETVFEVKSPGDYEKIETERVSAVSKDGTRVPVTVVRLPGALRDGHRPAVLTAYGGYGIVPGPRFLGPYLAWLERGGVYALANIRGGGEFGEGWHQAGMLGKKQNGFDDFFAAASSLRQAGWTDVPHLGIVGGSNGGLLMGAELTQHPDAYRAVVSFVGVYDMLRSELWPNGRYNVSEFGTVTDRAGFDWLHAYSPLHHVEAGVRYPAVLLITGVNDPRVAAWQSRKFAAALQAATSSKDPVLLLTRTNEGHGVTASFSQRVDNDAVALTFFAHELGLPNDATR